ncbi:hypothetical protein CHL76_05585 [Marinococcus halophilus]|uniref:Uncharacterized protein n=1 Tax=Marinococcus halophilus TaxID=1371 RepID=A0A510Y3D8_MARHA|nr:hypothetical protein [Marinococcus halophilus]OZT80800.1 hypothetical protein CHL76_05585 [Marinococcus halophilus]GEK57852.1 hypothetical protein MHA01_07570 [Marinococcus halophilus]
MTKAEVRQQLEERNMEEVLELIEDAENGDLKELELAASLGLLRDETLNNAVLKVLQDEGVTIIYVEDEE